MSKIGLLPALLFASAAWGQDLHPGVFNDGDRVFFAGDSITHIGKYQVFIADYYATRFPKRRITILNGGIGGDTAGLALKRIDRDIGAAKPTQVTVMLGMNDAGGDTLYALPEQEMLRARALQIERYKREWPELIQALRERGLPVTLIAPSPYDDTAQMAKPALRGKNGALAIFAEFVRVYGRQNKLPVVDFFSPLLAWNARVQAQDPTRTLLGKDRVHPGDDGYFAMAAEFLKAQQAPSLVSNTRMEAKPGATNYEFDYQANALPFPASDVYRNIDELLGFTARFNREMVAIAGLAPGEYSFAMNGASIGNYDARALSLGVNIATNPATPEQKQAVSVSELVHKRAEIQAALRDILWVKFRLLNSGEDPGDMAAARRLGETNARVRRFIEARAQAPEMERQVAALQNEIYRVNQPRAIHVVVSKNGGS